MKILKFTLIACVTLLMSCGSDDDSSTPSQPEQIAPAITVDVEAILALTTDASNPADITDLVNFGQAAGVSTADYTAEMKIDDTFTLGQPSGLMAGDTLIYDELDFGVNDPIAEDYLECVSVNGQATLCADDAPEVDVTSLTIRNILADATDLNWKYDIYCYIRRGGTDFGPYIIDPKIRIKSTSNQ